MRVPKKNIPIYNADTNTWSTTSFDTQKEFGDFLLQNCFKEPGEYGFDSSIHGWNSIATNYTRDGYYSIHPRGSDKFKHFWDSEKLKCRLGVIWQSGDNIWYLTRDYYFLLNYCRIINKEEDQTESFATPRDVQYHMCLYIKIAEIFSKHAAILKRRQMMFSYTLIAKCLNYLMFENKKTIKIFASDESYIDEKKGSWKILNAYIDFLNRRTAWVRPYMGTFPAMQQINKVKEKGTWLTEGNESTILGFTTKKDEKAGVGGPLYLAWYEEGGIAPTMDITLQYLEPAIENGNEKSGSMIMGGSVGDLDECKPLQRMIEDPDTYGVLSVPTKWFDETNTIRMCGLFIPAQYGMPQAVDNNGNSLVELALKLLDEQEEQWKKLPPEQYVLRKSQNPRTIKEAFRTRKVGEFASVMKIMENQQDRIKVKDLNNLWDFRPIKGLLEEDKDGTIIINTNNLPIEHNYPIIKGWDDKRGCVTIFEPPLENNPKFLTYFGGVDPIEADITKSSDSVASIDIFRKAHKIRYIDDKGVEKVRIEGDKLVATYRGRFDSAEKTNEQMWLLIKMYNAFSLAERSKPGFINYMRRNNRDRYLAKESDIPLFKDQNTNNVINNSSQYGFNIPPNKKESALWKFFKSEAKSYFSSEYGFTYNNSGEVIKIFRGVDRIDDYWLLEEFIRYVEDDGQNYDRISSFLPALALCKIYETNFGISTTYEKKQDDTPKRRVVEKRTISLIGGGSQRVNTNYRPKVRSLL